MRIRVWWIAIWLVLLAVPIRAGDFRLEQISHIFDSKGFEDEIDFWVKVFGRWGQTEIVYHDRRDLRIIYEVFTVDRAPGDDEAEWKRQRKILEGRAEEIRDALEELGRGEVGPRSQPIARMLTDLGYEVNSELCRQLAKNLRFQRGVKEKFRDGWIRSGKYLERIEDVFRREGLPIELAMMPHVESSFDYSARSKAGAAGMWQFVRSTGRLYMKVNRSFDERLDPIRSTEAAAKLLKENYEALGTWPLAVVAYNHGRYGMLRAKGRYGTDLLKITRNYQSRSFGFASRNFYPEFLAALLVARNHEDYFGPLQAMPPLRYETVVLAKRTPVSRFLSVGEVSLERLKEFNPHFTSRTWSRSLPAGLSLRVPVGAGQALAKLTKPGDALRAEKSESGPVAAPGSGRYKVRRGDTLLLISKKFGVPMAALAAANGLRDRNLIHPGQVLEIPTAGSLRTAQEYRVRRGDTLNAIARRFQVSLSALARLNEIADPHRIMLGQVLLIPISD